MYLIWTFIKLTTYNDNMELSVNANNNVSVLFLHRAFSIN